MSCVLVTHPGSISDDLNMMPANRMRMDAVKNVDSSIL
jgi:hypothetical protein